MDLQRNRTCIHVFEGPLNHLNFLCESYTQVLLLWDKALLVFLV